MTQRASNSPPEPNSPRGSVRSSFLPTRAAAPLVMLAVASLLTGMFLEIFGPNPLRERSPGADSYSASSIGHKAFVEMLRRNGIQVLVSRHRSAQKAGSDAVLVIAEPHLGRAQQSAWEWWTALSHAKQVLVVCPKWIAIPDLEHPEWIERTQLVRPAYISATLELLGIPAQVIRPRPGCELTWTPFATYVSTSPESSRSRVWSIRDSLFGKDQSEQAAVPDSESSEDDPIEVGENAEADSLSWLDRIVLGDTTAGIGLPIPLADFDPSGRPPFESRLSLRNRYYRREMLCQRVRLEEQGRSGSLTLLPAVNTPQLLRSDCLAPVIATDEGILVGETYVYETHIVVLSDPDVLANHGIARGDNALLTSLVLGILHDPGETVIMDESLHGTGGEANVMRELLRFPLVLVPAHVVFVVLLLLLATVTRFGSPMPATEGLRPGKDLLIANTAELMRFGGHSSRALHRYFTRTKQEVLRRLRGPEELDATPPHAWLQRATDARGVPTKLDVIQREINDLMVESTGAGERIVELARAIHDWRREMLHEP